jgi:transposase, IS30 family
MGVSSVALGGHQATRHRSPLAPHVIFCDPHFCDPHSPWQKGGVENANGRVRRFLPRHCEPEALARARLRRLADRLNDTPRRCLGYRTPREAFRQHLAAPAGPP